MHFGHSRLLWQFIQKIRPDLFWKHFAGLFRFNMAASSVADGVIVKMVKNLCPTLLRRRVQTLSAKGLNLGRRQVSCLNIYSNEFLWKWKEKDFLCIPQIHSFIHSFIYVCILEQKKWSYHSFVHSFVRSFLPSFITKLHTDRNMTPTKYERLILRFRKDQLGSPFHGPRSRNQQVSRQVLA